MLFPCGRIYRREETSGAELAVAKDGIVYPDERPVVLGERRAHVFKAVEILSAVILSPVHLYVVTL